MRGHSLPRREIGIAAGNIYKLTLYSIPRSLPLGKLFLRMRRPRSAFNTAVWRGRLHCLAPRLRIRRPPQDEKIQAVPLPAVFDKPGSADERAAAEAD